jgi:hypothetical protein
VFDAKSWNTRQEALLRQEEHSCSFCTNPAVGGPMATIVLPNGDPCYVCEAHFVQVRGAQDFQRRRMQKERRKWKNK